MRYTHPPSYQIILADSLLAHSIGNFNKLIDGVVQKMSIDRLIGTGILGGFYREASYKDLTMIESRISS